MNRVLVIVNGGFILSEKNLAGYEKRFDELIVVVLWRGFERVADLGCHPGDVLAVTRQTLLGSCIRPFYLLPFDGQGLSSQQILMRLSHFLPGFTHLVSAQEDLLLTARLMGLSTERTEEQPIGMDGFSDTVSRALFITRAQPFHNGHVEFLQQMLRHHDEAILSIACADQALTRRDPATAGERMEMICAYIHPTCHKRVWVVPFQQTPYMMEKIKGIRWLMPRFTHLYSTNPAHIVMGEAEQLSTCVPDIQAPNRATEIRERLSKDDSIHGMVPDETERKIYELGIDKRISFLYSNSL